MTPGRHRESRARKRASERGRRRTSDRETKKKNAATDRPASVICLAAKRKIGQHVRFGSKKRTSNGDSRVAHLDTLEIEHAHAVRCAHEKTYTQNTVKDSEQKEMTQGRTS